MRMLVLLVSLILGCAPARVMANDFENLLARNAEAMGGAENWARIGNLRYLLTIEEPGSEIAATYTATREGNIRLDLEVGGQKVFSEGMHEGQAWQWTPSEGSRAKDKQASSTMRHAVRFPGRFFTLQDLYLKGTKVTQEGEIYDQDHRQWRVRVTLEDEFSRDYFIDDESALPLREHDRRAFHASATPTEVIIETRKEDPAWHEGVLYFQTSRNINLATGEWLATTRLQSVEFNVEFDENQFRAPSVAE